MDGEGVESAIRASPSSAEPRGSARCGTFARSADPFVAHSVVVESEPEQCLGSLLEMTVRDSDEIVGIFVEVPASHPGAGPRTTVRDARDLP